MAAVAFGLFFLVFFGAMIAGLVFWIMKIVEVSQIPDPQYRAAGTDKTVWVLVVVLAGWIGALIWQFAKREDVLRARGLLLSGGAGYGPGLGGPGYLPGPGGAPLPPAGWYPEPGTGWFAYWDGHHWTGARQPAPQQQGWQQQAWQQQAWQQQQSWQQQQARRPGPDLHKRTD